ncbi:MULTISPECIES: hypothetical protein [Bacillus]|uniref:Uncharacterized protein n=2 Tax=Bacillus subtilis group TaxID=653685 RepID=A0AB37GPV3_BACLI|nr:MULTISPECIES: hypothetical protein [Bacillus]ARC72091.1 hypothetical protein B37_00018 [Bacillus licheniformis]ARW52699.1 hypothetical protein S100027_00682 [Bacillus licheniformis]ASB90815.1 hypothetical protein S101395_04313 [Bacillus sonorensis]AUZ31577.1 hypothetical protein C1T27_14880 [Bacillus licheniformis]AXF87388.1 hypothetical protein BLDA23_03395 [Bacillus licheniformis]
MSSNRIDVKILNAENTNSLISIIRKYSGEPISEIKKKISEGHSILTCYYVDDPDKLTSLLSVIEALEQKGAKLEIIQKIRNSSRVIDSNIIKNLIDRDRLIAEQIQEYDDNLSD